MNERIKIEQLVNLVIMIAGFALILIGATVVRLNTAAQTVVLSLGASLVASAVVAFLSSFYIKKYQHASLLSESWGIASIEERRANMNIRIDAEERKARNQIDIIAFGLKSLREGNTSVIEDCLRRNVKIRIITVGPENDNLAVRDLEEKKVSGSTRESILQLAEWCRKLDSMFPGRIQLKYSNTIPKEFYNRVDDHIFVGPYQYGKESQQTITTEYRSPGSAFVYYADYFEQLWADEKYCHEA